MSMKDLENSDLTDIKSTPFGYTISIIGGKWKMIIMFWFFINISSYSALRKCEIPVLYQLS